MHTRIAAALLLLHLAGSAELRAETTNQQKAREYYKAGKDAYAADRYQEAVAHFSSGYKLDPQPAFLLNIAQSYRGMGLFKEAIQFYQAFLQASPSTPLRSQVEEMIREMHAKLEAREARKDVPPLKERPRPSPAHLGSSAANPVDSSPPPASLPAPGSPTPVYKKWWLWTAVGIAVGTGIGLGIYAARRGPDYIEEGGLGSVRW
jgi:tetratricopeptide (TPR) repeat protein